MKIVVRIQNPDWRKTFLAVVEIDDQFGDFYKADFIRRHFTTAIAVALCDLHDPVLAVFMDQMNDGLRDLKEKLAAGLDLSLELYERQNAQTNESLSKESKPGN